MFFFLIRHLSPLCRICFRYPSLSYFPKVIPYAYTPPIFIINMTTKHPLRRSCAFCRARKIKCSNETICQACRRQDVDCIYDFDSPRPRARSIPQGSLRLGSPRMRHRDMSLGHYRRRSCSGSSGNSSPPESGMISEQVVAVDAAETVAMALEQRFFQEFIQNSQKSPSLNHNFDQKVDHSLQFNFNSALQQPSENRSTMPGYNTVMPTSILTLLTKDLITLTTRQEEHSNQFKLHIARDSTRTMFNESPTKGNPFSEYGQRQRTQLIDVWYSTHPLSFIVSKTLLLRELRDGSSDEVLLSVMMADAYFSMSDASSAEKGNTLLHWANSQLWSRPLQTNNVSTHGDDMSAGMSTRIVGGVSTTQILTLLAWNALSSSQYRRALCYLDLATEMASKIKDQVSGTTAGPSTSSRINGIEVLDVEKEVIDNLYWTTYSLSLWVYLQMGSNRLSSLLAAPLPHVSLPAIDAHSIIIQLDIVSENFSTLQKQRGVIKEMWPLAHITSIVTDVLCQHQHARSLEATLSQDISGFVLERAHFLDKQTIEIPSKYLVLAVYHTLAIHLLSPTLSSGQGDERSVLRDGEKFYSSAESLSQIFESVQTHAQDLTPSIRNCVSDVFYASLDSFSLAVNTILIHENNTQVGNQRISYNHGEQQWPHVDRPRLEMLASRFHLMSRSNVLNQELSLRLVRKRLRAQVRALGGSPGSDSSGSSSPAGTGLLPSSSPAPLFSPPIPTSSDFGIDQLFPTPSAVNESLSPDFFASNALGILPFTPPPSSRTSMGPVPVNELHFLDSMDKFEWQPANSLLQPSGPMPLVGDNLNFTNLANVHSAWYSHLATMVDSEMEETAPMSRVPLDWPELSSEVLVEPDTSSN